MPFQTWLTLSFAKATNMLGRAKSTCAVYVHFVGGDILIFLLSPSPKLNVQGIFLKGEFKAVYFGNSGA